MPTTPRTAPAKFTPAPAASPTLYVTDNGRLLCAAHLGTMAAHTGRDLSGQPIAVLEAAEAEEMRAAGAGEPACERCGEAAPAALQAELALQEALAAQLRMHWPVAVEGAPAPVARRKALHVQLGGAWQLVDCAVEPLLRTPARRVEATLGALPGEEVAGAARRLAEAMVAALAADPLPVAAPAPRPARAPRAPRTAAGEPREYRLSVHFQHPAHDERNGVPLGVVSARSRADAVKQARRLADAHGHISRHSGKGTATYRAAAV
jgi:hypothetical protein